MDENTVLVLANPTEPQLAMLQELPPETTIAVGNSTAAFEAAAPDATVIFNWSGSGALLRQVFAMAPRVRWVHSRAAGMDNQLFPALVASPAMLTNGSGVFSPPLGEFALAAVLYFAKDLRRMIRSQQAGRWDQFDVTEIAGQTAGILGYGDIGRAVASRLKPMGLDVIAIKRHGPPLNRVDPLVSRIYSPQERLEMIARCDYLVVCAPLTPETRGMIGLAEFEAMKRNAVVVNIGRGPVIDEDALIAALSTGRIKGAALDVFDTEPLPEGHPFYRLENVLLSPHCCDHTPDWLERAMRFFLDQFERFRKGEPLRSLVKKELGY